MNKQEWIKKIIKAPIHHKNNKILTYCNNKDVLDIGCIGQDNCINNPEWLHKKIKSIASNLDGADIAITSYPELKNSKFNIYHPDEIKELKRQYDTIIIADVIEHVENTAFFLNNYLQFLKPNGKLIITTPNPFSIRRNVSIWLYKEPGINPEHTMWLDPITFLEICQRLNLKIIDFFWLHEYLKPIKFRYKILFPLFRICYSFRKYLSPNFLFVLSK